MSFDKQTIASLEKENYNRDKNRLILRGANAELLVINVKIKQLLTELNVRRLISKANYHIVWSLKDQKPLIMSKFGGEAVVG